MRRRAFSLLIGFVICGLAHSAARSNGQTGCANDLRKSKLQQEFPYINPKEFMPSIVKSLVPDFVFAYLGRRFSIDKLNAAFARLEQRLEPGMNMAAELMKELGVEIHTEYFNFAELPMEGPLVVTGNHPTGGLDAIVLAAIIGNYRSDVKIVAIEEVRRIPGFENMIIPIVTGKYMNQLKRGKRPKKDDEAVKKNIENKKEMEDWIKNGHVLIILPSGNINTMDAQSGRVIEGPWSTTVFRYAKLAQAPILTARVMTQYSPQFYANWFTRRARQFTEIDNLHDSGMNVRFAPLARPEDYGAATDPPDKIRDRMRAVFDALAIP